MYYVATHLKFGTRVKKALENGESENMFVQKTEN